MNQQENGNGGSRSNDGETTPGAVGGHTPHDLRVEGCLGRIEGIIEHLATKADLKDVEAKIDRSIVVQTRWMIGTMLAVVTLLVAVFNYLPTT